VYAAGRLNAAAVTPTPGSALVANRLDVTVGQPTLRNVRCHWYKGTRRLGAYLRLPVTFQHVAGSPMLVQSDNFATSGGEVLRAFPGIRRHPDLASALVGPAYPAVSGKLDVFVARAHSVLRYVDPLGAGAAAWSYSVPISTEARLGANCGGSAT
jgi:hypothetical protein